MASLLALVNRIERVAIEQLAYLATRRAPAGKNFLVKIEACSLFRSQRPQARASTLTLPSVYSGGVCMLWAEAAPKGPSADVEEGF